MCVCVCVCVCVCGRGVTSLATKQPPMGGCLLHIHLHGVRVECVLYVTLPDNTKMADGLDSN